jgi:hypothetical protein
MADYVLHSKSQGARIAATVRAEEARRQGASQAIQRQGVPQRLDGVRWRNDTGVDVPAFALLEIVGKYDDQFGLYYTCQKPSHSDRGEPVINSALAVPGSSNPPVPGYSSWGMCFPSSDVPRTVLATTSGPGGYLGPVAGSFSCSDESQVPVLRIQSGSSTPGCILAVLDMNVRHVVNFTAAASADLSTPATCKNPTGAGPDLNVYGSSPGMLILPAISGDSTRSGMWRLPATAGLIRYNPASTFDSGCCWEIVEVFADVYYGVVQPGFANFGAGSYFTRATTVPVKRCDVYGNSAGDTITVNVVVPGGRAPALFPGDIIAFSGSDSGAGGGTAGVAVCVSDCSDAPYGTIAMWAGIESISDGYNPSPPQGWSVLSVAEGRFPLGTAGLGISQTGGSPDHRHAIDGSTLATQAAATAAGSLGTEGAAAFTALADPATAMQTLGTELLAGDGGETPVLPPWFSVCFIQRTS